ncbi:hypothetical protein EJB05_34881, partial [Eragrostis curvula]
MPTRPSSPVPSDFNASPPPIKQSYLQALLTPAAPSKRKPRTLPPITTTTGCYRSLALDHSVRGCRDPVRCRNCRGSGHRQRHCKMPLLRVQTPMPGRRATALAFPSPGTRTPPPPATPASPTASLAIRRSASTGSLNLDHLFRAHRTVTFAATPPASPPSTPPATPQPSSPYGSTSPPPPSSPIPAPNSNGSLSSLASDEEEFASGDDTDGSASSAVPQGAAGEADAADAASNGGEAADDHHDIDPDHGGGDPNANAPPDGDGHVAGDGHPDFLAICVPQGRWRAVARYAYAYLSSNVAANPAPFIHAALHAAAPDLAFELLPSSRGNMLLRFPNIAACEFAVTLSPIYHDGGTMELEHSADTGNRFLDTPEWLAYISVLDYPLEHWFVANIRAAFRCFGTVVEIDPTCLSGFDYSSLRLIVEVRDRSVIPEDVWITAPGGAGCIVRVTIIHAWPRAEQVDEHGQLVPFFFHPPPPPPQLPPLFDGHWVHQAAALPDGGNAAGDIPPFGPAPPPHDAPADATLAAHNLLPLIIQPIHAYPLPPLPALPIIIPLAPPSAPQHAHAPRLALPWYDTIAEPLPADHSDAPDVEPDL